MNMNPALYTHRVAVNAFLIHHNTFLLLKRAQKPLIWGPPGGKLMTDEDPIQGLQREVAEETGLQIKIFQPVTTWFGHFNNLPFISIDYLCTTDSDSIKLSQEHRNFRWLTIDELIKDKQLYFTSELGFKLSDFQLAWQTYLMNNNQ
jgi:8-oxo-dGTP diphosphatase